MVYPWGFKSPPSHQMRNPHECLKIKRSCGFLLVLENEFRKMLSSLNEETKQCGIEIIEAINNCSLELERNVSPALAVDNLLMRILEIKYNYKV